MGKQQSKETEEKVLIVQNGAGNGAAAAAAAASESDKSAFARYELYLLFIIACILMAILYIMWSRCKINYARYIRRELQDIPLAVAAVPREASSSNSCPPQRVIL